MSSTLITNLIGTGILFLAIIVAIQAIKREKKIWNNGFCPKCGAAWKRFDTSSQGDRGYKCSGANCFNYIWISYYHIDRVPTENPKEQVG